MIWAWRLWVENVEHSQWVEEGSPLAPMPILVKKKWPFLSWDLESQRFMAERPPCQLSVTFGFILNSSCKSSLLGLFILLTLLISSALSSHLKAFGWSPGTCGVYTHDKTETHSGTGCWGAYWMVKKREIHASSGVTTRLYWPYPIPNPNCPMSAHVLEYQGQILVFYSHTELLWS